MNTFLFIKIIAFITMVIDHIGSMPYEEIQIFRMIGRISFPLFCMLISYGCIKSKRPLNRIFKLFLCGLISYPIYSLYFGRAVFGILISYALFSLFIYILKRFNLENTMSEYLMLITLLIITGSYNFEYSWYTIALCYLFYKLKNKYLVCLYFCIITFIYSASLTNFTMLFTRQDYALLALPFIFLFYDKISNNEVGERKIYTNKFINFMSKNLFYILYPLHLLILYIIKICIY